MSDPCQGLPSGELYFPGSIRMERHRISHCSACGGLGQSLSLAPFLNRMGLLLPRDSQPRVASSWSVQKAQLRKEGIPQGSCLCGAGCAQRLELLLGAGPARPFLLPLTVHRTGITHCQYHQSLCWWLLTPSLTLWGPHRSAEMATSASCGYFASWYSSVGGHQEHPTPALRSPAWSNIPPSLSPAIISIAILLSLQGVKVGCAVTATWVINLFEFIIKNAYPAPFIPSSPPYQACPTCLKASRH